MEKLSSTLFSMIFKSPLPFNDYNPPEKQPFPHVSLSRPEGEEEQFFSRKKEGVEASPRTPLISRKSGSNFSVPTGSA